MSLRCLNQVNLLLQAAGGIGKDTAFAFAEAGAIRVVFADRDESGAREAAERSKAFASNPAYSAIAVHVEVTDVDSVKNMVDAALEGEGRIDYFVHSAGVRFQAHPQEPYQVLIALDRLGKLLTHFRCPL